MNSPITKVFLALILSLLYMVQAQAQLDPALALAITTATDNEQETIDKTINHQSFIGALHSNSLRAMEKINEINNTTFNYLMEASTLVGNLYDIKRAVEISKDIGIYSKDVLDAIKENKQGLFTTALGTKTIQNLNTEVKNTYLYIASIGLSKKTLLNAAERTLVIGQIVRRLDSIKFKIYLLAYNIRAYTLKDIPRLMFPHEYYKIVNNKQIAERIIREMKPLKM